MKIKKNDLFIGIYLLAAVLFFIISIPSWLLDILLAINMMVALVVLFNSLFAKEVGYGIFPYYAVVYNYLQNFS